MILYAVLTAFLKIRKINRDKNLLVCYTVVSSISVFSLLVGGAAIIIRSDACAFTIEIDFFYRILINICVLNVLDCVNESENEWA